MNELERLKKCIYPFEVFIEDYGYDLSEVINQLEETKKKYKLSAYDIFHYCFVFKNKKLNLKIYFDFHEDESNSILGKLSYYAGFTMFKINEEKPYYSFFIQDFLKNNKIENKLENRTYQTDPVALDQQLEPFFTAFVNQVINYIKDYPALQNQINGTQLENHHEASMQSYYDHMDLMYQSQLEVIEKHKKENPESSEIKSVYKDSESKVVDYETAKKNLFLKKILEIANKVLNKK